MAFCGVEVLCLDRCVQKASEFLSLCSISTTASLVNKVHSVSQLAEMCVSVSILIQSISMGSMSYSVCCCSLCVCARYLNTWVFVACLLETVCLLCMYNPLQSASVCIWQSVHACVCVYECVRTRSGIPWAASYNVSGGDGGNLKALHCPNQN